MERHVDKRSNRTSEISLAMWLQNGRAAKGMSLDDVARVTKIQPRILERLEAGKLDGLPAEVFVRGFVRSFARCVGLDEAEALRRYTAASPKPATVGTSAARAMVEAMGDLVPTARADARPKVEPIPPEVMPSGSLEMPAGEIPAIEIEIPEPMLADASEMIPVPTEAAIEAAPVEAVGLDAVESAPVAVTEAVAASVEAAPVEAVVIAPPPAIDLTATEAPAAAEPTKKKRTRKAAEGGTSRRKRSAIANGTPSEAMPVVASDASEAPAPKRRRKAKGTEAPPVEASSPVVAPVETVTVDSAAIAAAPVVADAPVVEAVVAEVVVAEAADVATSDAAAIEATQTASVDALAIEQLTTPDTSHSTPSDVWVADLWASEMGGASLAPHADELETTQFDRPESIDLAYGDLAYGDIAEGDVETEGTWTPKMPPIQTTMSAPWRRPNYAAAPALVAVIDDADPESAERALEDRRGRESRRTFLPPILLDREGDRSARQGGLTLAVIILLIAATLTLSYLMRRPSSSGDGVTTAEPTQTLDTVA